MKPTLPILTHRENAREEIQRRQADASLRNEVEHVLGHHFWPEMRQPRGVLFRCLPSPDNGYMYFQHATHWLGLTPFLPEYNHDKFVHINAEKKGLARLRLTLPDGTRVICDIVKWNTEQGKPLSDVIVTSGDTLAEFHHRLFDVAGMTTERREMSDYFKRLCPPANYYFYYMSHFVAHGVVFEAIFEEEDPREDRFTHEVIYPSIERIEKTFGVRPLIVQLYPPNQTPDEDFYWWSYPPQINDYLVKWVSENKVPIKPWHPK